MWGMAWIRCHAVAWVFCTATAVGISVSVTTTGKLNALAVQTASPMKYHGTTDA